jgi:hypothetical protein
MSLLGWRAARVRRFARASPRSELALI